MNVVTQGNAVGNLRQRRQIKFVSSKFAAGWRGPASSAIGHPHIATGPVQAVTGVELQPLCRKLKTIGQKTASQPTGYRQQFERQQLRVQRRADAGECHIGSSALYLRAIDVYPGTHGASTLRNIDAQVGILAQVGNIHPVKRGIDLTTPFPPAAFVQ